jgi:hypothetical protein
VTIKNTGVSDLVINSIDIAGTNQNDFNKATDCSTLSKGGTCTISVTFTPKYIGKKSATMSISSNDPQKSIVNLKLLGDGNGNNGRTDTIAISTTELPAGKAWTYYSQNLTASAASGMNYSYKWAVVSGALPDGLTLNEMGTISGTPLKDGTFTFVVKATVTSDSSMTATRELSISIGNIYIPFAQLGSAWFYTVDKISGVLTFMADKINPTTKGSYMLAMKYNDNSGGGIQTGEYSYDPSTGQFSVNASTIKETNSSLMGFKNQTIDAAIAGIDNTLVYTDGGTIKFIGGKVVSASNPLIGSWSNINTTTNTVIILTFIDGTNYAHAFNLPSGKTDSYGGFAGVEFGTYSYAGGILKNTSISVDTNGGAGFSSLPSGGISMPLNITNNTITLPARSSSASPVVLDKVQ